jgi:hypothetical protein
VNGTFTALKALNVPFTANDRTPRLPYPSKRTGSATHESMGCSIQTLGSM